MLSCGLLLFVRLMVLRCCWRVYPFLRNLWLQACKEQCAASSRLRSQPYIMEDEANTAVVSRFARMWTRLRHRAMWSFKGTMLWLVQRPYLRRLPFPLPGVADLSKYMRQHGAKPKPRNGHPQYVVTNKILLGLIELRTKLGYELSFLEDKTTTDFMDAMKIKKGALGRLKDQVKTDSQPAAAATGSGIARLGPRGGLPRTKAELQALARDLSLSDAGTVEELKNRLRDVIEDVKTTVPKAGAVKAKAGTTWTQSKASAPWPVQDPIPQGSAGAGAALDGSSGGGAPYGPSRVPPPPPPPARPPQRTHIPFWEQQEVEVEAWHIATPVDDNMLWDGEMMTEEDLQEQETWLT